MTVDSLRKDAVPAHGFGPERIENDVPEQATVTRFDRAFATGPGTTPSFPALLTGQLPLSENGLGPLTDEDPRVAEMLAEEGYATAGFQCNPFLSTHFGYDVGFDTFEDYQNPLMGLATRIFPRGIEINNPRLERVDDYLHLTDGIRKAYQLLKGKPRPYVSAEVITDDTLLWLEQTEDPFFCWTHYMDVHHPCYPPSVYRERQGLDSITQAEVGKLYSQVLEDHERLDQHQREQLHRLYQASVDYTSDQTQRILHHLRETDRLKDTLVVITSDHGELFGEWDDYGKPERMYDELLHVPLIVINGPSSLSAAREELISLIDVPPLIWEALDLPEHHEFRGQRPGVDEPREYILAEHEVHSDVIVGARSTEWRYERDMIRDESRLYDLRDGRDEQVRLEEFLEQTKGIRGTVNQRLEELDLKAAEWEAELDSGIKNRLEDLGYL